MPNHDNLTDIGHSHTQLIGRFLLDTTLNTEGALFDE
jgi:hypothetical protein